MKTRNRKNQKKIQKREKFNLKSLLEIRIKFKMNDYYENLQGESIFL